MNKARVLVGYTRSDLTQYRTWESPKVVGADIEARDGCGNVVKVSVRQGDVGFRVSLNDKTVLLGGLLKQDPELMKAQ